MNKYPSVTQILPHDEGLNFVSKEKLEATAEEGKDNHGMVKLYWHTGETFNNQYLESYHQFIKKNPQFGEMVWCENELFSEKYKFIGHPDVVFEHAITDLKRSLGDRRKRALQFAGYHILLVENKIIKPTDLWYVLTYDAEKNEFKATNVYRQEAIITFKRYAERHYLDVEIQKYYKIV